MCSLSRRVSLRGEDPGQVARAELIRLGLLEGEASDAQRQALKIAVSFSSNADGDVREVQPITPHWRPARRSTR